MGDEISASFLVGCCIIGAGLTILYNGWQQLESGIILSLPILGSMSPKGAVGAGFLIALVGGILLFLDSKE